jgi:penicillin-binding protein 1A
MRWRARTLTLGAACGVAAVAGATLGSLARIELPGPAPPLERAVPEMTLVLDRGGATIASFARARRLLLEPDEIPESFRLALLASEDSRFERHVGIDPIGCARAAWSCLRHGRVTQGASTLTMQLAGNLFLDRAERTLGRKVEEVLLAFELERRYSKREILTLYCNHAHFGHGIWGLEAAARHYFGKPARWLGLAESAMLVGVLPRPASYSPFRNPELARRRRDLVLRRMVEEGYLAAAEAARVAREPIRLAAPSVEAGAPSHFVERVRRSLVETHGPEAVAGGGLVVRTTLDRGLQESAERAIAHGLERLGPGTEGALVAIDPRSGEVLALVGGREFEASEFDRAVQARRQPGSLFKPFVFAAALERGRTLADVVVDEPTVFLHPYHPEPYRPENYERVYHGAITLRTALERSANVATVKLLDDVGAEAVIGLARRLGLGGRLEPWPSLALGAFEVSLLEITSAYGAFAAGGLWIEPHWIMAVDDREGRPLERARPRVREALDPRVAYLVNQAMAGAVAHGTGQAAGEAFPGRALAGKTGTTDGFHDAWFVGYTPELVAGVWVGHDDGRSLGEGASGARAALPVWIEFMREALAGREEVAFEQPPGIVVAPIDPRTGLRPRSRAGCGPAVLEYFLAGSEPTATCDAALHRRLALPQALTGPAEAD